MSEPIPEYTPPHFTNDWTTGTILASVTSIMSLLGMVGSVIWFSARVDATVSVIPNMAKQQETNTQAIAIEATKQLYTDSRYVEIQTQLANIQVQLQAIQSSKR